MSIAAEELDCKNLNCKNMKINNHFVTNLESKEGYLEKEILFLSSQNPPLASRRSGTGSPRRGFIQLTL
jgi:hypothetical protein